MIEASNLLDMNGQSLNHLAHKGAILERVNDFQTRDCTIDEVELHIFGPEATPVELVFSLPPSVPGKDRVIQLTAKRHLLVQFAMGLTFSPAAPYEITRIDEVLDPNDMIINDAMNVGDALLSVDGLPASEIRWGLLRPMPNLTHTHNKHTQMHP